MSFTRSLSLATAAALMAAAVSCARTPSPPLHRSFTAPEDAVRALADAAKAGNADELIAIFGPDGKALIESSDPATSRRNREVFTVAVAERWRLEDRGATSKTLVIGYEDWPFPVPLTKDTNGWRFDTAAGKEEVLARRIGRNELAVVRICRTYVAAQRVYAERGHDGRPPGRYARNFRSDPGKRNGLYWPAGRGEKRSPLGDLVAYAAQEGTPIGQDRQSPAPFHGYYFKILTAQGSQATGGAREYVVKGEMTGGFGLVAWPAQYDVTGIMTFIVNQDGVVRETDFGPDTDKAARAMTLYDPDASWAAVQ
jgi:hypothetical protein